VQWSTCCCQHSTTTKAASDPERRRSPSQYTNQKIRAYDNPLYVIFTGYRFDSGSRLRLQFWCTSVSTVWPHSIFRCTVSCRHGNRRPSPWQRAPVAAHSLHLTLTQSLDWAEIVHILLILSQICVQPFWCLHECACICTVRSFWSVVP